MYGLMIVLLTDHVAEVDCKPAMETQLIHFRWFITTAPQDMLSVAKFPLCFGTKWVSKIYRCFCWMGWYELLIWAIILIKSHPARRHCEKDGGGKIWGPKSVFDVIRYETWLLCFFLWLLWLNIPSPNPSYQNISFLLEVNWSHNSMCHVRWCENVKNVF